MAFTAQTFSVGQVLTAATMTQVDDNIDQVRYQHKGAAAPGDLAAGVLWLEDDNPSSTVWTWRMYDGASWIDLVEIDSTNNEAFFLGKAKTNPLVIRNAQMRVAQRGTSIASLSDGFTPVDGWRIEPSGSASAVYTASQESAGGTNGNDKWLKILVTTADATPGVEEASSLEHRIEAQDAQVLLNLTNDKFAGAVVSFDVIAHADGASSITFPAKLGVFLRTSDGTARQYVSDVTITTADTWQRVSVVVPSDATATIDNDTGPGLTVGLGIYGGTNKQATADVWANDSSDVVTANSKNWTDATNNYIGVTRVKLERGADATPFEHVPYIIDLAWCQRYLVRWTEDYPSASAGAWVGYGHASSTTNAVIQIRPPVPMRTIPTWSISAASALSLSTDGSGTLIAVTADGGLYAGATETHIFVATTVAAGLTAGVPYGLFLENGSAGFVQLSAEL